MWLGIALVILRQTFCRPWTQWKTNSIALKSKNRSTPRAQKEETAYLTRHTICPDPAGEIMDYLHMQLCLRKMNEEHLAEGGIWEKNMTGLCNTNKRVCWEIRGGCCFRGRHYESKNCFHPLPVPALFKMSFGATRPGLRQVLSTSSSPLPQTDSVSPSAE